MNIDRMVFAFAGLMIILSVSLSVIHSQHWLWLTGFVGLNLFQSAFSGFCPLAKLLKLMGFTPGTAFN